MKSNFFLNSIAAVLIIGSFFSGCKCRDKEDKDTQTASDYDQGQLISEDISNMADAAAEGQIKFKTSPGYDNIIDVMSGCATVSRDTDSVNVITITINFGTSNCLCMDNRFRRGIITITHFGDRWTSGSYRAVSFNNYFVNDHQVEGVHTITANGQNGSGNWNWTITGQNMKISRPDGKWHSWNSTRNREWLNNGTPLVKNDDAVHITGSAMGTNINGHNYSATIISTLRREAGCKWIVKGAVQIIPDSKPMRTLDFGTGSCDDKATVTINGNTYNITLH